MKHIGFVLALCSSLNLLYAQNRVVNEGILKIESGTTVYIDTQLRNEGGATLTNDGNLYINEHFVNNGTNTNNGLTEIERDFRNNGGDIHVNNGDFYVKRDFRNRGVTSATTGTTYLIGTIEQEIYNNAGSSPLDETYFNNLQINNTSGTGVLVDTNMGVHVQGTLTLTSGDLRLEGEAQLIQGSGASIIASSGSLLRDRLGGSSTYAYNYFSAPVHNGGDFSLDAEFFDGTDAEVNSFSPQNLQFSNVYPYNGAPATVVGGNVTVPLTISTRWLYTYTAGSGTYSEWMKITESSPISPGLGFTMKGTGTSDAAQNYVFKGIPNNGTYTIGSVVIDNSYLIGNPYPSAIDADQFIMDNDAVDALLFWVDGGSSSHILADYLGSYATRNLTTGAPPSVPSEIAGAGTSGSASPGQYVAVGQGFFVQALTTDPIVFNNAQRTFVTESAGDSEFFRPSGQMQFNPSEKSIVRIGYEDPEGFHRQIALGFVPDSNADLRFNRGYDAPMSAMRDDEMYFIIEEDSSKKYVIQGVGAYDASYTFPIGLKIEEEGSHTIMLDGLENFEGAVYLFDRVLGKNYVLNEEKVDLNLDAGVYSDRFLIAFQPQNNVLGLADQVQTGLRVFYDNNKNLTLINDKSIEIEELSVFNTLGQQLEAIKGELFRSYETKIPFHYPNGLYIIVVESNGARETFKILY